MDVELDRVRRWLGWPPEAAGRLEPLARAGPPPRPFALPADLPGVLAALDVPPRGAAEILAGTPHPKRDPEAWWLLERLYHRLVERHRFDDPPPWPAPHEEDAPLSRYFHLYVFLAAVPDVLAWHGAQHIPPSVTWATLRDVGLQIAHYHARHGRYGFDGAFWVYRHFRGGVFQIGRLQYEPARATYSSPAFAEGDPVVGVHIPALGPLTPASCSQSLRSARTFFDTHFPDGGYRFGTCTSWLLDPQLRDVLPPHSNIVSFQRRFTLDEEWRAPGDRDVQLFTFGRILDPRDEVPEDTTLRRAVVRRLRSGGGWHVRRGWLSLPGG